MVVTDIEVGQAVIKVRIGKGAGVVGDVQSGLFRGIRAGVGEVVVNLCVEPIPVEGRVIREPPVADGIAGVQSIAAALRRSAEREEDVALV